MPLTKINQHLSEQDITKDNIVQVLNREVYPFLRKIKRWIDGAVDGDGPIGPTGATGATGPTGATGATGATGPLVDENVLGGQFLNGVTGPNGNWRALSPESQKSDEDADVDLTGTDVTRLIVTNRSLTANRQIIISPGDYVPGTGLDIWYLHASGNAFRYTIVTSGIGTTDSGIVTFNEIQTTPLATMDWDDWDEPNESRHYVFRVIFGPGDDGEEPPSTVNGLEFMWAEPLTQDESIFFA